MTEHAVQTRTITHYLGLGVVARWLGAVMISMAAVLAGIVRDSWLVN